MNLQRFVYDGPFEYDDYLAVLRQADIVLNTSHSEGMSSTILESLYYGKLVMARDNEGNRAIL